MLRPRITLPRDIFPADPWLLEGRRFMPQFYNQAETATALANGYLGIRGSQEEDRPTALPGTFLNGFHELRPIVYGEEAYGFPKTGQTMLKCPDGVIIKLYVDDEPFSVETAELLDFRRALDLRRGVLERDVTWRAANGRQLRLETTRLVSFANKHLIAVDYTLHLDEGDFVVSSELINRSPLPARETGDPRLSEGFTERVLQPAGTEAAGGRAVLSYRTRLSGMTLGCGMDHTADCDCDVIMEQTCADDFAAVVFRFRGRPGATFRLRKYLAYHYSKDGTPQELRSQVNWTLRRAVEDGFPAILERQQAFVSGFWDTADVTVEGVLQKQQVIRWNLFQLLQASGRVEGHSIGARGLTGETYEGHYFWDTEIYVLPFLIYTNPRIARSILLHRYGQLDKARARARELSHRGVLFPWRTINGDEASAYFAASTAQYHINADIMYAMRKYVDVTGDRDFLLDYGAEMLIETARLWADLGSYTWRDGLKFFINGVTGPDEYTAIVNNNYFTNLMARDNLRYSVNVLRMLQQDEPERYAALAQKTGFDEGEIADWENAADHMYLPYDEALGIHPQDDSFLDKKVWDFANTSAEKYPLLLHYHPLTLYRYQVIKQADVALALFLLSHEFSREEKKRNFDYYDPLTTGDSSLSVCIQSIIASEIGYGDKALEYFNFAATMDLADIGGNMAHGAHIASIGGSWLALVYGFGGLRDHDGRIGFQPHLPADWQRLRFPLTIRGNLLDVDMRHGRTTYTLRDGPGLTVWHDAEEVSLSPASPQATKFDSGAVLDRPA